ncbi:MAG: hypothetical protein R3F60_19110 [bacterium]
MAGDAEVEQLHGPLVRRSLQDEDVVGLDVAVDDLGGVGGGHGLQQAGHDPQRLEKTRVFLTNPVAEADAAQALHGDVEGAVGVAAGVVDGGDAGVADGARHLHLAQEALDPALIAGRVAEEPLDRDLLLRDHMAGRPHLAHAAGAEALFQTPAAAHGDGRGLGHESGLSRLPRIVPGVAQGP